MKANEFQTASGLPVKRLYRPTDCDPKCLKIKLGEPGSFPFTRGIHLGMCRTRLWIMHECKGNEPLPTNTSDEALSTTTEEAVKIAHRTLQMIAYERTRVTTAADPLGRSYHVESLADRVEQEVLSELDRIRDNAFTQQVGTETGKAKIVGVNVLTEGKPSRTTVHKIQSAPWRRQISRLKALKKGRFSHCR